MKINKLSSTKIPTAFNSSTKTSNNLPIRPHTAGDPRQKLNSFNNLKTKSSFNPNTDERENEELLGSYKLINLSKAYAGLTGEKLKETKKLDKIIKKIYFKNEKTREIVISKEDQIMRLSNGKK